MKVHLHPQYTHLREEIVDAVKGNYTPDKVFCNRRNVVEKITMQGKPYVVKRYKQPNLANRIAYTVARRTKACRAYEHAVKLIQLSEKTPHPVAYVEKRRLGLFSEGYFFAEYMPHETVRQAVERMPKKESARMLKELVDYSSQLHAKGILPRDFNATNIFVYFDGDRYHFALTDINRMRFGKKPSTSEAMRSFEQLGIPVENICNVASLYCSGQQSDIEYSIFMFLLHRLRSRIKSELKHKVKQSTRLWHVATDNGQ